jgi:hypothetical protein
VRACGQACGQVWACAVQAATEACHCSEARFGAAVLRRSQLSAARWGGQRDATANEVGKSHDFGRNDERALRHGMYEFRARARAASSEQHGAVVEHGQPVV